jgi:hypothetical protein
MIIYRMVLYQDMPFQSQTTTKTLIGASKPYDKATPYPPPYDVSQSSIINIYRLWTHSLCHLSS